MAKDNYPQYRVSQWIDTTQDAMDHDRAVVVYGIQTKREEGGRWSHLSGSKEPMFFNSPEEASDACDVLRDSDATGNPVE
jgi:hypothetical protein